MGNVNLITAGDKVGMSEATLLNMLGISPFTYGLVVNKVYDSGSIFDPTILDITDEDLKAHVLAGIRNMAAVTDITFKEAETMKAFLADPSAFAVAAPVAAVEEVKEATPAAAEESEEDS